jgi:hypothetical protein
VGLARQEEAARSRGAGSDIAVLMMLLRTDTPQAAGEGTCKDYMPYLSLCARRVLIFLVHVRFAVVLVEGVVVALFVATTKSISWWCR